MRSSADVIGQMEPVASSERRSKSRVYKPIDLGSLIMWISAKGKTGHIRIDYSQGGCCKVTWEEFTD